MRSLEYWQEKFSDVLRKISEHQSREKTLRILWKDAKPLRKMRGYKLNSNYYGEKIYLRRKLFLRHRLIDLTKMAKHRKEHKRLIQTKLFFYEKQIESLGGTVDRNWHYKMWTKISSNA